MKVLNFGSLNLDLVYQMEHIVQKEETYGAGRLEKFPGGKGLNQSVALANAGAAVYHAGNVGADGEILVHTLKSAGVDVENIRFVESPSGHAVIQVDRDGDNAIILMGGANQAIDEAQIDQVLSNFGTGDYLVLQNEVNMLDRIIEKAFERGMCIVLNPSPIDEKIATLPLHKVSIFMLNEIEGRAITGRTETDEILDVLSARFPNARVVLTLGGRGSVFMDKSKRIKQKAYRVPVVDTTAAGDTFTGFFVSGLLRGESPEEALDIAARASAIAVSREGAAPSIPSIEEVCNTIRR